MAVETVRIYTFKVFGLSKEYKTSATTIHKAKLNLLDKHKELSLHGFDLELDGRRLLLSGVCLDENIYSY